MSLAVNVIVVLGCGVLVALLVQERSVTSLAASMAHRHADARIAQAEAQYQERTVEIDRLRRNLDQVSGRLDGALKLSANLKTQIRELNTLADPSRQADTLRTAAAKMNDGQVTVLAREMGFTKVRLEP